MNFGRFSCTEGKIKLSAMPESPEYFRYTGTQGGPMSGHGARFPHPWFPQNLQHQIIMDKGFFVMANEQGLPPRGVEPHVSMNVKRALSTTMAISCVVGGFVGSKSQQGSCNHRADTCLWDVILDKFMSVVKVSPELQPKPRKPVKPQDPPIQIVFADQVPESEGVKKSYAEVAKAAPTFLSKKTQKDSSPCSKRSRDRSQPVRRPRRCSEEGSYDRKQHSRGRPRRYSWRDKVEDRVLNKHWRKSRHTKPTTRELGSKRLGHRGTDLDGSLWAQQEQQQPEEEARCRPALESMRERRVSSSSDSSARSEAGLADVPLDLNDSDTDDDSFIKFESTDETLSESSADEDYSSQDSDEDSDEVDWCPLDQGESSYLAEVNRKWLAVYSEPAEEAPSPKKVCFSGSGPVVHRMVKWDFAYRQARKGPWEEMARDRDRFWGRIQRSCPLLSRILDPAHRARVLAYRASLPQI